MIIYVGTLFNLDQNKFISGVILDIILSFFVKLFKSHIVKKSDTVLRDNMTLREIILFQIKRNFIESFGLERINEWIRRLHDDDDEYTCLEVLIVRFQKKLYL